MDWIKEVSEYWDRVSDSEWYRSLRTEERIQMLVADPASTFHPGVYRLIKKYVDNFAGKKILLPSSGDNHAAFALALMGAKVTSADISERQLENAKVVSDKLGLDIEYVCDNTVGLPGIHDEVFDLVYTSNGTLTWIGDLNAMYAGIRRVLKKGGISVTYDLHPFNRPFNGAPWKKPEIVRSYHDVLPSLHWRVQDIVNAMLGAGLSIREMAELPAEEPSFWFTYDELIRQGPEGLNDINDWKKNPMAALPAWLCVVSQRM